MPKYSPCSSFFSISSSNCRVSSSIFRSASVGPVGRGGVTLYGSRFFVRRLPEPLPVLSCDGVGDTAEGARLCVVVGIPEKELCALLGLLLPCAALVVGGGPGEGLPVCCRSAFEPGGVIAIDPDTVVVGGLTE